jgi:opacity protein-like surface antigen
MKRFLAVLVASLFLASAAYAADAMKEEKKAGAKATKEEKKAESKGEAKATKGAKKSETAKVKTEAKAKGDEQKATK